MKGILGRWSNLTLTASTTSTFRLSGREKGSSIGSDTSTSNYYIDPYMQWAPEDTPTQVQATRLLLACQLKVYCEINEHKLKSEARTYTENSTQNV